MMTILNVSNDITIIMLMATMTIKNKVLLLLLVLIIIIITIIINNNNNDDSVKVIFRPESLSNSFASN